MEEQDRMNDSIAVTTDLPKGSAVIDAFDRPEEIGCFSLNSLSKMLPKEESEKMKKFYFHRDPENIIGLDLSVGFKESNFQIRTFPKDKIDNVLDWIKRENFDPLKSKQVDFVCSRGAIAKLLCTPYSTDSWRIQASKFQGTIYFSSVDTEAKHFRKSDQKTEDLKKKSYYGLKFEQYMTAAKPDGEPDPTQRCDEQGMFCAVFKNRIGKHTLLFRAEMDAAKNTDKYVELKTLDKGVHDYPIYKSLSMWAQSIVTGVEDIICGITDDKGVVTDCKEYKTQNLHIGQIPYACEILSCEYKFDDPGEFERHVERHLTDKELKKGFKIKSQTYQCRIFRCQEDREDFRLLKPHIMEDHVKEDIKNKKKWTPRVCKHFLNEVLNWLKSNLVDDPKKVYELNYNGGGEKIQISEVQIIGKSYVQEFRKAMQNTPVESEDLTSDSAGPSTLATRTRSGSFRGAGGNKKKIKRK